MELVLKDCSSFASVYIDDVLLYSKDWEEHLQHLRLVLEALRKSGLTAKPYKQAEIRIVDRESANIVQETLYDGCLPLLLDTGAQISVIPEEMVPPAAKTGQTVQFPIHSSYTQMLLE